MATEVKRYSILFRTVGSRPPLPLPPPIQACLFCPLEDVHPPPRELSTHDFFQPTSNGAICDESVRENLAGLLPKVRRLERDNLAGPLPKSVTVAGCRIALRMYSYDLNRGDRTNFSHLTCSESHVLSLELTQRSAL